MVGRLLLDRPGGDSQEFGAEAFETFRPGYQQPAAGGDVALQGLHHGVGKGVLFGDDHGGELGKARQQCPLVQDIYAVVGFEQRENGPLHRGRVDAPHQVLAFHRGPGMVLGMQYRPLRDGLRVLTERSAGLHEAAHGAESLHAPRNEPAGPDVRVLVDLHIAAKGAHERRLLLQHGDGFRDPGRIGLAHAVRTVEVPEHDVPRLGPGGQEPRLAAAGIEAPNPRVVAADPVGRHAGLARIAEGLQPVRAHHDAGFVRVDGLAVARDVCFETTQREGPPDRPVGIGLVLRRLGSAGFPRERRPAPFAVTGLGGP